MEAHQFNALYLRPLLDMDPAQMPGTDHTNAYYGRGRGHGRAPIVFCGRQKYRYP